MQQFNIGFRNRKSQAGFTLIEMIGVLAIIALLVAVVAPRIFKSVTDSKISNMAMTIKTIHTSVSQYFKDVNVITAIDATTGVPVATDATGDLLPRNLTRAKSAATDTVLLLKKFNGPYLEKFNKASPAIGTTMTLPYAPAAAAGAGLTSDGTTWDIDGDGTHDMTANQTAVSVLVTEVNSDDFDQLDKMLDPGIGATNVERRLRGKVKYDTTAKDMRVLVEYK